MTLDETFFSIGDFSKGVKIRVNVFRDMDVDDFIMVHVIKGFGDKEINKN